MAGIQPKVTKQAKKQENTTMKKGKKSRIKTNPELM